MSDITLKTDAVPITPDISPRARAQIYAYIGAIVFIIPFMGLWSTKVSFILKDQLHLNASSVAGFWALMGVPGYLGFAFGFARDRWAPFGRKDQGLFLLFGFLSVVSLLLLAWLPVTYPALFFTILLFNVFGQFLNAAQKGLTSLLGNEHVMSGRIAAVWLVAGMLPSSIVSSLGGWLTDHCTLRQIAMVGAIVSGVFVAFSALRPTGVYDDPGERQPIQSKPLLAEVLRLLKTPAIYPVIMLHVFWAFTPGVGTAMQFYVTDVLHGTAKDFGNFNALFLGCFIPTYLMHGFLSTRINFRTLLWVSTFFAVPQILPLLIVHNASTVLIAAVPMGLMGGFATATYSDLLIRACPSGLEGSAMLLVGGLAGLSASLGDVAGAKLYDWHGFAPCAWATFFVYALMLPTMLFVPKRLTAYRDGELPQAA